MIHEDGQAEARIWLAHIVASQVHVALDESDLTARAVHKFRERWGH